MAPIGDDVRLGVACLGVTHAHTSGRVRAVQRHGHAAMRGCADEADTTQIFADALGLEVRGKQDILDDPEVHAVLVHSKSDRMAALSIEALEAGKAVLVEKPAGRGAQDTRDIAEAVKRTGGLLQVGYCWRFSPDVEEMQKVIRERRLGEIFQVRGHGACHLDEAATSHLNQPQDVGGSLFVIGCHMFERMIYHFGMPQSVNARVEKFAATRGRNSKEDAAGAILNYPDKIVTVDFMSWDPGPWLESWEVDLYGTQGIMRGYPLPTGYRIYDKGDLDVRRGWSGWKDTSFPVPWGGEKTAYSPELSTIANTDFFDREFAAFSTALRTGGESPVSADDALKINTLIEALYTSAEQRGAEVAL